jgi:hypothetical protein
MGTGVCEACGALLKSHEWVDMDADTIVVNCSNKAIAEPLAEGEKDE